MLKSPRSDEDAAVLFVRGMLRDLLAKLKAAAALQQKTLGEYIQEMCTDHVQELEKKGVAAEGERVRNHVRMLFNSRRRSWLKFW
jgi:hypothetical protein